MHRLKYVWFYFAMKVTSLLPDLVPFMRFRGLLLKPVFRKCGSNFQICSSAMILSPEKLTIGNDVYIAYGCWIQGAGGIELENEVMLGPYTILASSNHTQLNNSYRFGSPRMAPIVFRKGSWTGSHVTVVGGVEVGEGSACAANSAITKNVAAGTVVGGVPGKPISNSRPI